ncbi:MAG: hypothetical protein PVI81_03435 [Anaerolineales bacterium]|jgi:hypothetical protein
MTIFLVRVSLFTLLPLVAAAIASRFDPRIHSRSQRMETYLVYLFGLGVAGGGIGGFFGHMFLSDFIAESVGWPAGSPFQLEMGFTNLAVGVLGFIALSRRDGFREATVIAVTVISVGASIVHFIDIFETGNLAPGNTIQNISNLLKPALLIGFLIASRRADSSSKANQIAGQDLSWRDSHLQAAGWLTGLASSGFGIGFMLDLPVLATILGALTGAAAAWITVARRR